MIRQPLLYKTVERDCELKLTTRSDKLGNIFHVVEYLDNQHLKQYAFFMHLSSALDFISSNFK